MKKSQYPERSFRSRPDEIGRRMNFDQREKVAIP